jgi:hypothetical protein
MRPPDIAIETGIEMDVALDEAGHHQPAAEIDTSTHRYIAFRISADPRNFALRDGDCGQPSIRESGVPKQRIYRLRHGSPFEIRRSAAGEAIPNAAGLTQRCWIRPARKLF